MSLQTTSRDGSNHLTTPLAGPTGLEIRYPQADKTQSSESNESKPKDFGRSEMFVGCILCNELIDNFPVHRFRHPRWKSQGSLRHVGGGESHGSPGRAILTSHRKEADQLGLVLD